MRVKLYLLQDIPFKELQNAVANFVDSALCQNESLISFHETNCYKFYLSLIHISEPTRH